MYRGARDNKPTVLTGPSYFASAESFAKTYGPTAAFKLELKNPWVVNDDEWLQYTMNTPKNVAQTVKSKGKDSIVNVKSLPNGKKFYTVFLIDPSQATAITTETQAIDDGISSPDGHRIVLDRDEREGEYCMVPTEDEEQDHLHKVYGIPVWAAYKVSSPGVTAMRTAGDEDALEMGINLTNIRRAVKHPDENSRKILSDLVDTSIERFMSDPNMNKSEITVIIPLGSNSKTNLYIAGKLSRILHNAVVLKDFLTKDVWKNVQASRYFWKMARKKHQVIHGYPVGWAKEFLDKLEKRKQEDANEKFAVKGVLAKQRLYYSMFYKTDKSMIDAVKKLNGANVLVIDDTLEAGATIIDAKRELDKYNIKSMSAFILLYGKDLRAPKGIPVKK